MATIQEWMRNKTILLTGGSGFFGKVLTEKLLRTCPNIKRIYSIVRPKQGFTGQERWAKIEKDKLFEMVLSHDRTIMKRKLVILGGDLSLTDFGLPKETLEELKETVDIIFTPQPLFDLMIHFIKHSS